MCEIIYHHCCNQSHFTTKPCRQYSRALDKCRERVNPRKFTSSATLHPECKADYESRKDNEFEWGRKIQGRYRAMEDYEREVEAKMARDGRRHWRPNEERQLEALQMAVDEAIDGLERVRTDMEARFGEARLDKNYLDNQRYCAQRVEEDKATLGWF